MRNEHQNKSRTAKAYRAGGRVPLTKVVDRDLDSLRSEFVGDDRLDLFPFTTSKPATDAGHVDARLQVLGLSRQLLQALSEGIVADRRPLVCRLISVLGDHVGDPEVLLDCDELNRTHAEVVLGAILVPGPIGCFRTIPPLGEGTDEALAPSSLVAADVGDNPVSRHLGLGGIAFSAVYLRIAGANNSIVGDAKVFLTRLWIRRRLAMGPYSMDLRERVAAVIDEGEGSQRQVAKRFRVSVSFVTRLLQRRRDAGTLAPKPHGGGPRPVLGFPEQVRLAMLIAEHPDATLEQLKERGGFACTLTTIWRTLRRFRLTYKKKTLHARERDDPKVQAKRRRYRRKVEQMDAKRLVFVDETGINTAMTPTHAWARRGKRAIGSVPTSWGSTTVIAALGLDGVRAPLVFPGATDTQAFQTYVDEVLAPELHPGDVVIFDNLKPHLAPHVAESIERAGASVLPLPPYSSDYDPIEELWSKFKGELRRVAARVREDLYNAVGETLDHVTLQDILGWFNHSGLYATHA